jgi:hypothetical protein
MVKSLGLLAPQGETDALARLVDELDIPLGELHANQYRLQWVLMDGARLTGLFVAFEVTEPSSCTSLTTPMTSHNSSFWQSPSSPMPLKLYLTCGTLSSSHCRSAQPDWSRQYPATDTTHWVDLGRVLKHDLVLVVNVAELLLGNVDTGARDKVHLDTVRPEPTCKESANGPLTLPSWRSS